MDLWIWNWVGGGYNSCRAATREEALEKAKKQAGDTILVVDEKTLHIGTQAELNRLDAQYASLFY